ncbi:MAG TPA: DUF4129 domain-containing protein [Fimbriimonadaceae bacterium]|jgi:hypothetical protein
MLSKIVSSFSLSLCLCGICWATGYLQLRQQFEAAGTSDAKIEVLEKFYQDNPNLSEHDPALAQKIEEANDDPDQFKPAEVDSMLALRASVLTEGAPATNNVESQIKSIKSSPLYKDTGTGNDENWLSKAFSRLFNRHSGEDPRKPDIPEMQAPNLGGIGLVSKLFIYGLIGLLIAAVIFFLVLAFRHFKWKKTLKHKASALLEEDEPERSADEWLRLAEGLSLQGRFREAVRCLYLACLLRIDEAKVARFIRSETNWEHLARIQASPKRPPSLDMLSPTKSFDRIWYGHQVRGAADVDQFKIWYEEVVASLRAAEAAA